MTREDFSPEQHENDEDGEHDPDDCDLCVERNHTKTCACDCGRCCELFLIEVSLRDAQREPRIPAQAKPICDDDLGQGPRELIGYLLNDSRNGMACTFFDRQTRRCTIYETRPLVCRLFDCDEQQQMWMIDTPKDCVV